MTAAVAWDLSPTPARARTARPARPARPRLVSVPCGDAVAVRPAAPLRITRAGRLAITLAVVAAVAVAVAIAAFPSGAPAGSGDHATTVQPGQTLSEIAAQQLPGLAVPDAVARIQIANDLTSAQVHAGQSLVIPAVP